MRANEKGRALRASIRKEEIKCNFAHLRAKLVACRSQQHLHEQIEKRVEWLIAGEAVDQLYVLFFRSEGSPMGHISEQIIPLFSFLRGRLMELKCTLLLQCLISTHSRKLFRDPQLHEANTEVVTLLYEHVELWVRKSHQLHSESQAISGHLEQIEQIYTESHQGKKFLNVYLSCLKVIALCTDPQENQYHFDLISHPDYLKKYVIPWLPLLLNNAQYLTFLCLLNGINPVFANSEYHTQLPHPTQILPQLFLQARVIPDNKSVGLQSALIILEMLGQVRIDCEPWVGMCCKMIVQLHTGTLPQNNNFHKHQMFLQACDVLLDMMEELNGKDSLLDIGQLFIDSKLFQLIGMLLQFETISTKLRLYRLLRAMLICTVRNGYSLIGTNHLIHNLIAGIEGEDTESIQTCLQSMYWLLQLRGEVGRELMERVADGDVRYTLQALQYSRSERVSDWSVRICALACTWVYQ